MTWRVTQIRGSSAVGGTWRVAQIRGTVANAGTWRVAQIRGSVSTAPPATWRVAQIRGSVGGTWRVAQIRGAVTQNLAPVVAAQGPFTVDPVVPFTVTMATSDGSIPDSWSFTASNGVTITPNGSSFTVIPPGTMSGLAFTVTVTATKGGNTSSPVVVSITSRPDNVYYLSSSGTMKAQSYPQYSKG